MTLHFFRNSQNRKTMKNHCYSVILRILGFNLVPHLKNGKYKPSLAQKRSRKYDLVGGFNPVSKWLVTPVYKPFSPFGRGITLHRELTNHVFFPLTKWDDPPSSWWLQPSWKNISQIGSFPIISPEKRGENKDIWNHHLGIIKTSKSALFGHTWQQNDKQPSGQKSRDICRIPITNITINPQTTTFECKKNALFS